MVKNPATINAKIPEAGPICNAWAAVIHPQLAVHGVPTAHIVPTITLQKIMKKKSMKLKLESDLKALYSGRNQQRYDNGVQIKNMKSAPKTDPIDITTHDPMKLRNSATAPKIHR